MRDILIAHTEILPGADLQLLGDAPVLYHCHHFNLFLDQTIDDAIGFHAGEQLRRRAAHAAARQILASLAERLDRRTPAEIIDLAQTLFAAMGHGRLSIEADTKGGKAHGEHLHYGHSWMEKYGHLVRRRAPADAVAAGFAAAAVELAQGLAPGALCASEHACVAMREPACSFEVVPQDEAAPLPEVIDRAALEANLGKVQSGLHEDRISKIVEGLRAFLAGVAGDDRGLVQAFGVYVTLHFANYYNRISYEALERVRARSEALLPVFEDLLRESGQVCVFHTFGGILLSPEWEGLVGAPTGDVEEHVIGCTAIARALGFGHWVITELDPARRLVLRTPSTYETAYFAGGRRATAPSSYFLQGAAVAFMELAHRVPWTGRPTLSDNFYRTLFRRGRTWRVEQTMDTARGDACCEVVVTPL